MDLQRAKLVGSSLQVPMKQAAGTTRVVSISDTHLCQESINLPLGDVLVHAGDILTESKLRHIKSGNVAKDSGVALFETFAQWFCSRPHPFKVLIAGNHDGCLEAMGADRIRAILDKYTERPGSVVYLEHETAQVSGSELKVFGSPYGHWGSHNDAFSMGDRNYKCIEKDTHIVVTHSPPILPSKKSNGPNRESRDMVSAIENCGALLSVSGHCHWAYGVYFSYKKKVPFVVASSCGSGWQRFTQLEGTRLDKKWDYMRGGYNLKTVPVVSDIAVPPPPADAVWVRR